MKDSKITIKYIDNRPNTVFEHTQGYDVAGVGGYLIVYTQPTKYIVPLSLIESFDQTFYENPVL